MAPSQRPLPSPQLPRGQKPVGSWILPTNPTTKIYPLVGTLTLPTTPMTNNYPSPGALHLPTITPVAKIKLPQKEKSAYVAEFSRLQQHSDESEYARERNGPRMAELTDLIENGRLPTCGELIINSQSSSPRLSPSPSPSLAKVKESKQKIGVDVSTPQPSVDNAPKLRSIVTFGASGGGANTRRNLSTVRQYGHKRFTVQFSERERDWCRVEANGKIYFPEIELIDFFDGPLEFEVERILNLPLRGTEENEKNLQRLANVKLYRVMTPRQETFDLKAMIESLSKDKAAEGKRAAEWKTKYENEAKECNNLRRTIQLQPAPATPNVGLQNLVNQLNGTIQLQTATINNQIATLRQQAATNANHNTAIQQHSTVVANHNAAVQQLNQQYTALNSLYQQQSNSLQNNATIMQQASVRYNQLVLDKQNLTNTVQTNNSTMQQRNLRIQQLELAIQEHLATIAAKNLTLKKAEEQLSRPYNTSQACSKDVLSTENNTPDADAANKNASDGSKPTGTRPTGTQPNVITDQFSASNDAIPTVDELHNTYQIEYSPPSACTRCNELEADLRKDSGANFFLRADVLAHEATISTLREQISRLTHIPQPNNSESMMSSANKELVARLRSQRTDDSVAITTQQRQIRDLKHRLNDSEAKVAPIQATVEAQKKQLAEQDEKMGVLKQGFLPPNYFNWLVADQRELDLKEDVFVKGKMISSLTMENKILKMEAEQKQKAFNKSLAEMRRQNAPPVVEAPEVDVNILRDEPRNFHSMVWFITVLLTSLSTILLSAYSMITGSESVYMKWFAVSEPGNAVKDSSNTNDLVDPAEQDTPAPAPIAKIVSQLDGPPIENTILWAFIITVIIAFMYYPSSMLQLVTRLVSLVIHGVAFLSSFTLSIVLFIWELDVEISKTVVSFLSKLDCLWLES